MKKINLVNKVLIFFICLGLLALTGCKTDESNNNNNQNQNNNQNNNQNQTPVEITNEHTTYSILEDTIYETTVHLFKSNVEGPRVAIVGGIHGDEIAGWKAALELVKRNDFKGEVLIIPQAHILADTLEHRYPGYRYDVINTKEHNGIKYSDLNRTFGQNKTGVTQTIADAIEQTVREFNPEYIIDLHESRRSSADASSPLLGDLIIYGNSNSCLFAEDMVYEFNQKYLLPRETAFGTDTNAPVGSFCNHFGTIFPNSIVFTIETNREYYSGQDTADLSRRIEQQLQMLDIFFGLISE